MKKKDLKHKESIQDESHTLRIYLINVKTNTVSFFNRSSMSSRKVMTLKDFYNRYHPSDSERVKNWIFNICLDSSKVSQTLEVDIITRNSRHTRYSMLKLLSYNETKGIIHLESTVLRFVSPNNEVKKARRFGVNSSSTFSSMKEYIKKSRSIRGYTFSIRFFNVNQNDFNDVEDEKLIIGTLKNVVYPFASETRNYRSIVSFDENQILFCDLKLYKREDALSLATSISSSLRKCILINGYSKTINFSIGIVFNKMFYQDFDDIVKHASEASMAAEQDGKDICFYEKNVALEVYEGRYSEQIENLIKDNKFKYLFRPIVDVGKGKVFGYLSFVKLHNAPFSSYVEMMSYASKTKFGKDLFSKIATNLIPKYISEVPHLSIPLFYHISIYDLKSIETVLPQIDRINKANIVLVFLEQEINQTSQNVEKLIESLRKIHSLGFRLALSLVDKNLLLSPDVYTYFDYFITGTSMTGDIRKNDVMRLSIRSLIESLLKYKRPILATGLDNWQSVELIIKSGITLISSEIVSSSSEMILPIDKKKMEKLIAMDSPSR